MRLLGGIVAAALLATLLLVAVLAALPDQAEIAADVYLIFLGGIALLGLVVLTGRSGDDPAKSPFAAARRPRRGAPPVVLPELDRLGRELSLGMQSAFDFHVRLRPVLQEIAEARLAARGRRLEDAEGLLGPEAWQLVRPDQPAPADRHAPGADLAAVHRFVDTLEKI